MTHSNFVNLTEQLIASIRTEARVILERFVNSQGNNGEYYFKQHRKFYVGNEVYFEPNYLYIDDEKDELMFSYSEYLGHSNNEIYLEDNDVKVMEMDYNHLFKLIQFISLDEKLFVKV